ncbi:MAG: hypothetical protein IPG08_09710 [Sphingobacteriaceae bacterium]|nr:hypothetical protein [Sphingobacteriaceae bacterium]
MKRLLTILISVLVISNLGAQDVNYKTLNDEPKNITNFSCNLDLCHFDGGFNQIDGWSFNLGAWGHGMLKQRLGVDYTFRYGWLTFGKLSDKTIKPSLNIQAGGFLIFSQNIKQSQNKIVLKTEDLGYVGGGKTATKVTYIMVPSSKWKYRALRAGVYMKRGVYRVDDPNGPDAIGNFYMLGAYGGICFGKGVKLSIQTDKYGVKGFATHTRICLDALITPIHNAPAGVTKVIPIGGRILIQTLPSVTRKEGKKKYNRRMVIEGEAGYRLADGLYIACTIAIPITRNLAILGKPQEDTNTKRTAE